MKAFANNFRRRFDAVQIYGARNAVAEAAGVNVSTVSGWAKPTKQNRKTTAIPLPNIYEIFKAAQALGVSPAWLAFEQGPQSIAAAMQGFALGEQLESDGVLAEILRDFPKLDEAHRAHVLNALRLALGSIPPFTSIKQVPGAKLYEPPPAQAGTNPKEVAGEEPAPYAGGSSATEDAVAEVRARGGRMKRSRLSNVDLAKAKPVPPQEALRLFDEKTAASKDTGGGPNLGPIVEETEPAEVRYPRDTHYTLAVTGTSMYPRIFPGDRIIVERVSLHLPAYEQHRRIDPKPWKALDGEIVVAVKNQDEVSVVKRLCFTPKKDGSFRIDLMSDNPGARPIDIDKEDTLEVIGVVRQILRDPRNVG